MLTETSLDQRRLFDQVSEFEISCYIPDWESMVPPTDLGERTAVGCLFPLPTLPCFLLSLLPSVLTCFVCLFVCVSGRSNLGFQKNPYTSALQLLGLQLSVIAPDTTLVFLMAFN